MPDNLSRVKTEDFTLEPSLVDGYLVLSLAGLGDMLAVGSLRECLDVVKCEVLDGAVTTVEFDIRRLMLLNSSCLKVLVTFLVDVMSAKSKCPIRFIVDAKSAWQARSLFALERLGGTQVTVVPR
jgi:hypothetical protein